jgi:hypothetical protein
MWYDPDEIRRALTREGITPARRRSDQTPAHRRPTRAICDPDAIIAVLIVELEARKADLRALHRAHEALLKSTATLTVSTQVHAPESAPLSPEPPP